MGRQDNKLGKDNPTWGSGKSRADRVARRAAARTATKIDQKDRREAERKMREALAKLDKK